MKVLVFANIYPTRSTPTLGTFIYDQVEAMRDEVESTVICKRRRSRLGYVEFWSQSLWAALTSCYDLVHAHYGFHSGLVPALAGRAPMIVTFHGDDALSEPDRTPLHRMLQRRTIASAAHVVAVSNPVRRRLIDDLGARPEKISVIPCGVDTSVFKPRPRSDARARLGIADNARVALFIGRLTDAKGAGLIREAARKLCDVRFVLIGEGPCTWMAPNCKFLGSVPHSEVPCWLNASDVLLLPSDSEGTPVCVLEALASEVPVVASRVGGIPDLIQDGITGLLIPPRDAWALVHALEKVFGGCAFDAPAGRRSVTCDYDLKVTGKRLHELYRSTVGKC